MTIVTVSVIVLVVLIHRFVRVCPKAPIEGTQAVESFVGANGNGVVCLLWTSGVCCGQVVCVSMK